MLSQLASARRVKIGDPAVLARLQLLDQRCAAAPPRGGRGRGAARRGRPGPAAVDGAATGTRCRSAPRRRGPVPTGAALRAVAPPARLAAAAAALAAAFPELAEVLRQAARGAGAGAAPAAGSGPRRAPRRRW